MGELLPRLEHIQELALDLTLPDMTTKQVCVLFPKEETGD